MSSSRGGTPDLTIQIYEDPDNSDHEPDILIRSKDPFSHAEPRRSHGSGGEEYLRDGSETEVVEEADDSYDGSSTGGKSHLDIVKSIEEGPIFEVSYTNDRNVSNTTAIHLDGTFGDPFLDSGYDHGLGDLYEEDTDDEHNDEDYDYEGEADRSRTEEEDEEQFAMASQADSVEAVSRQVSEFSALPDELDASLPEAPSPPVWSQRSFRHAAGSPNTPTRSNRLQSSPQNSSGRYFSPSTSNAKDSRFVSSPLARQSPSSAAFRNLSSVRAMQLSSPSPPPSSGFAHSPRSARKRRLGLEATDTSSRNVTPSRSHQLRNSSRAVSNIDGTPTPSKQVNPKKEYPLVLLHCSFSSPPLPYPPSVLRAVLPDDIQEGLALLREKLGLTVLERGVLVPHPGEDYELLEERVLESLELKAPRLGKCGHFVGSTGSRQPSTKSHDGEEDKEEVKDKITLADPVDTDPVLADPKCETCGKHVVDQHRGCEGDGHKRWDIRVYASNGLMRAGAWSAAWREMEKVDVEISVWLSEELRVALERETQSEYERGGGEDQRQFAFDMPMEDDEILRQQQQPRGEPFASPSRPGHVKADERSASTAAVSRPSSSHRQRRPVQNAPLPLSTLLLDYVKRNVFDRTDRLLQVLVVLLAVALFRQWQTQVPSPSLSMQNMEHFRQGAKVPVVPVQPLQPDAAAPDATTDKQETSSAAIPACTFAAGEEEKAGMTVLPADLARLVLSSATALAQETNTVQGELSFADVLPTSSPVAVVNAPDELSG